MGSCYANFGLRKYFGGVPKFPLRDVIENTRVCKRAFKKLQNEMQIMALA